MLDDQEGASLASSVKTVEALNLPPLHEPQARRREGGGASLCWAYLDELRLQRLVSHAGARENMGDNFSKTLEQLVFTQALVGHRALHGALYSNGHLGHMLARTGPTHRPQLPI